MDIAKIRDFLLNYKIMFNVDINHLSNNLGINQMWCFYARINDELPRALQIEQSKGHSGRVTFVTNESAAKKDYQ